MLTNSVTTPSHKMYRMFLATERFHNFVRVTTMLLNSMALKNSIFIINIRHLSKFDYIVINYLIKHKYAIIFIHSIHLLSMKLTYNIFCKLSRTDYFLFDLLIL